MFKALTIAGSDSGGGAGIQADLKTFQELAVYGMSVVTAVTAQNSLGVHGVYPVPLEGVKAQLDAVLSDIGADAVKIGMLASEEAIGAVAGRLKRSESLTIVADPVMVSTSGTRLLPESAVALYISELLPICEVVTPNIPEACAWLGSKGIQSEEEMLEAANAIRAWGPRYVLLKGGHRTGAAALDLLWDGKKPVWLESPRIQTPHTHGTGCTLSAAITAELANGRSVKEAVLRAKLYVTAAIRHSFPTGSGMGSLHHAAMRKQKSCPSI